MRIACQSMDPDEITPPPGHKFVSGRRRLREGEWRPNDELLKALLEARERAQPGAVVWLCPDLPILRPIAAKQAGADPVREAVAKLYGDRPIQDAVMLYWAGKGSAATHALERIYANTELAPMHQVARRLVDDISAVEQLIKQGQTWLGRGEPDRADGPFREALAIDERLLKEHLDTRPSQYRNGIQKDMAQAAFRAGKAYNDTRKDPRGACKTWKLGFTYYAGNADLNNAVNWCTQRAVQALESASSCLSLEAVLDMAVPGDMVGEKLVPQKKAELGCP
jgi:hypothetical protein